jgi:hypothetical protein
MGNNLTIRQKISRSKLSETERMLREEGVVEVSTQGEGSLLTALGRRIVLDILWEDAEIRKKVVELVKAGRKAEDESDEG